MKTEQILLIVAGFYFLQQMRRPAAPQYITPQQTSGGTTGSAGNQGSGGSVDTSQYFDPNYQDNGSGGDAARGNSDWDNMTKKATDAIGGWLCKNVSSSLPGCP